MHWLKRGRWKLVVALVGILFVLVFMVWLPLSTHAYDSTPGLVAPGIVQATPTVDVTATMTALNEEKLRQEIQQLKNQNGDQNNWFANNSTPPHCGGGYCCSSSVWYPPVGYNRKTGE